MFWMRAPACCKSRGGRFFKGELQLEGRVIMSAPRVTCSLEWSVLIYTIHLVEEASVADRHTSTETGDQISFQNIGILDKQVFTLLPHQIFQLR
jgi:hypothetical protein